MIFSLIDEAKKSQNERNLVNEEASKVKTDSNSERIEQEEDWTPACFKSKFNATTLAYYGTDRCETQSDDAILL